MAHTFITMDKETAERIVKDGGDIYANYLIDPVSQAAADRTEALAVIESKGGYVAPNGNIYYD